jgi:hypothetical protein
VRLRTEGNASFSSPKISVLGTIAVKYRTNFGTICKLVEYEKVAASRVVRSALIPSGRDVLGFRSERGVGLTAERHSFQIDPI